MDARDIPFEVPEPSDFDVENIDHILGGMGDWFGAHLLRLIAKADLGNRDRLRMAFPFHVQAYERYLETPYREEE